MLKTSSQTLTEQLAARFAERIRNHLLAPGARLPSVRQCAQQQKVSASTVVAAYDKLLAQGLVEARRNRGFFVRGDRTALFESAGKKISVQPRGPAPVNATALIRGMFHQVSQKAQPGTGLLPREWLHDDFLLAAVRKVTKSEPLQELSFQYGEPKGDSGLRRSLSHKLASINVAASPDQIITTVGATHALDTISRTLLRPGDPVMVEDPGWAVEFARLSAMGMQLLPVPRGPEGPDLDLMAQYCKLHRPKLYVSVSVLHNPTSYTLTPGSAHRLLQLATEHGFYIVEDDTYSHIAPVHATRLSALDGLRRTIYVSGFTKIVAPNWRIGYIAAPPHLVDPLLDTKLLATLTTPALLEKALSICIDEGQLRRHAERLRARLDDARSRTVKLATAAGCRFVAEPAGMFGWVDTGMDTDAMAQRMLDEGHLIAPGALFHAERRPSTLMRINFATTQDTSFWQTYASLAH